MNNKADDMLTLVGEKLKFTSPEDTHDVTGKNIAGKLRTLDPMMRIYAEKIIYDALLEAQLGTLNRYARIEISPMPEQNVPNSEVNNLITDKSIHISGTSLPLFLHDTEQNVEHVYQNLQPAQSRIFSISNLIYGDQSYKNLQETPGNDVGEFLYFK